MPQYESTGWTDPDFGKEVNDDAAEQFVRLKADKAESQNGRMVRKDAKNRMYWFKNGRNKLKLNQACLEKYYAVIVEDNDGQFYVAKCADILAHPHARTSHSSKHGDKNPHLQLPVRTIREIGTAVEPADFAGLEDS
jgi:hypothetical protein